MAGKSPTLCVSSFLLILATFVAVPVFAGSAVIGLVAGSLNATVGGVALLPNTAIYSGDTINVKDGIALVALGQANRITCGRNTQASFLRNSNEVTVLLGQGNVSLYHPDDNVALKVKVGDLAVLPASGFKTLGEIAMVGGTVVVTAREGLLRVEGNGPAVEVAKGKTIAMAAKAAKAQGGAAAGHAAHLGGAAILNIASAALAVVGAVEGALAISRANDARNSAISATSAANGAAQAATLASSAANAAAGAANAASSAASVANNTAICAGLALDKAFPNAPTSPFVPPAGVTFTCP